MKFSLRYFGMLVLGFSALAFASASFAVETGANLTITQALEEARGQNPELRRISAAEKEASWAQLDAISVNLPQLGINANHLFKAKFQVINFGGNDVSIPSPFSLASLDATWTVFDGFGGINSFRAAHQMHVAAEHELSYARFSLDETVRARFYEALGAQILADVAQQNVKTLQDHLQKTNEILERGSATKFDLLRVQVQYEEALSDKAGADDNVVLARKKLAVVMGTQEDSRPLIGDLPVPDEATIPVGLKPDFAAREDLEALRNRADAADILHTASYGKFLPKLTFTAEKQFYNNINYNLTDAYRDAYVFGVALSWNIFDGGSSIARGFESHYRAQQAEATAEAATLKAPEDFETYKRRYVYNAGLYRAKRRAVEMAQESVRLATLGYNAGTRTSTDVLDAELDLIRARAGVVRAQVDGIDALIHLELAVGKDLHQ